MLLPFSVLGPFVGVLLDRWSRRQVLARSNFVRVGLVALLAVAVHADLRGPVLFGLMLVCLSVNRFLLAGLSASLPHVVAEDDLITANALTPTAGTLAFLIGLGVGAGARIGWEALGADGDVGVLLTAAVLTASPARSRCASPATCSAPTSPCAARRRASACGTWPAGSSTGCATWASAGRRRTA